MPAGLDWKVLPSRSFRVTVSAAAAVLLFPGICHAQSGFYGSAMGSVSIDASGKVEAQTPLGGEVSLENGYSGEVSVGYRWESGWRLEATALHLGSDLKPGLALDHGGSISMNGLLLGAFKEFGDGPVRPYLGASAGFGRMKLRASSNALVVPVSVDDSDTVLTLRLGAGAVVPLSQQIGLDIGYRFNDVSGYNGTGLGASGPGSGVPSVPIPVKVGFSSHMVTAGLRVSF